MIVQTLDISRALRPLLSPGDDVLIHASLGQVGNLQDGPDAMIDVLQDAVGPGGTVIMMTDTRSFARTGRFSLDQPSETGLLTERFRLSPGAVRSRVPMVSFAARGARAAEYTQSYHSHLDETATMTRLLRNDGKILLIGVQYEKCTLYHLAEERHGVSYNFYKEFSGVLVEDGREVGPISQRYFVRKDMTTKKDPSIAGRMIEDSGAARTVSLGNSHVRAFRARAFDECCMQALAADHGAFLA